MSENKTYVGLLDEIFLKQFHGKIRTIPRGPLQGYRWKISKNYHPAYGVGIYDFPILSTIESILPEGGVFYDIGANTGYYSLALAKIMGKKGKCFSFEPVPAAIREMKTQININKAKTITIVRAAVSEKTGTASFYCHKNDNSYSSLYLSPKWGPSTFQHLRVRTVSLDDFVINHPPPSLVKIDVQGAAALVLGGFSTHIKKIRPIFIIELHGKAETDAVHEVLKTNEYVSVPVHDDQVFFVPKEMKITKKIKAVFKKLS